MSAPVPASYEPLRYSEPRAIMTIFGPAMLPGPFIDDYTDLKWQFTEHWSGEWASFRVAGLEVFVRDCDGDSSWWELRDLRTKVVLAKGDEHAWLPLNHFWKCLLDAEAALRAEVARRKAALASPTPSADVA